MTDDLTRTDTKPRRSRMGSQPEPHLVIADHPDSGIVGASRVIPDGGQLLMGRAAECCLPGAFEDELVSRRHALIERHGDRMSVTDLGSRNGTFVNGTPLLGSVDVAVGDVLAVGNVVVALITAPPSFPPPNIPTMIGIGPALGSVAKEVRAAAQRDVTVLILGETGTGKELVSEALHRKSGRKGPLVALNCAGVSDALLASELFGHVRGAFTGAHERRRGLLEAARGGTLLLDEVADASATFQASLLRLLETRRYRPVGSDREQEADVRFLAACQPGIRAAVAEERFRPDLWARLAQWVVELPPLRERPEDIPALAREAASRFAGRPMRLAPELSAALMRHTWPFNIRELHAAVQRALADAEEDILPLTAAVQRLLTEQATSLAPPATSARPATASASEPGWETQRRRRRPTKEALVEVLKTHHGNMTDAALALGVSRKTLYRWADALDIDHGAFRND